MTKKIFLNKSEFETKYNNGEKLVYLVENYDEKYRLVDWQVVGEIKDMYDKQKVDELPFFTCVSDAYDYYEYLGKSAPQNWQERLYTLNFLRYRNRINKER